MDVVFLVCCCFDMIGASRPAIGVIVDGMMFGMCRFSHINYYDV